MNDPYSTTIISDVLIEEIKDALRGKEYGSVEIYVESGRVVQVTERKIKKMLRSNGNGNKKEVMYWKPIRNGK